ncbi:MAG: hypothetical protein Q8L64_05765 [bacterium]|nr:hypothetical protein [bacterium]
MKYAAVWFSYLACMVLIPLWAYFRSGSSYQEAGLSNSVILWAALGLTFNLSYSILLGYTLRRFMKRNDANIRAARGRPASIEKAFSEGDPVRVLAITPDEMHAVLQGYFSTRFVKLPAKATLTGVQKGKNYIVGEGGSLLDVIKTELADSTLGGMADM